MVWYPDKSFILMVHERMLTEFGGHKGIRQKRFFDSILNVILDKMKEEEDTYMEAAILLRELATTPLFEDANKRTAFTVTHTFLSMNGVEVKRRYEEDETLRFLKALRQYTFEEIAGWLKSGRT